MTACRRCVRIQPLDDRMARRHIERPSREEFLLERFAAGCGNPYRDSATVSEVLGVLAPWADALAPGARPVYAEVGEMVRRDPAVGDVTLGEIRRARFVREGNEEV